MARRAKHEILATAVESCAMVSSHGLWYFTGHFTGQWNAAEFTAKSLFQVHVYFTRRRILFEMGGIQSVNTLLGDPKFSPTNNPYDIPSYKKICAEFGVEPTADFRFTHRANYGLGKVFIYVSRYGPTFTGMGYPGSHTKFADEGGKARQKHRPSV